LVIGAGISGASIARELSRWKLNVMLVEKGYDVALQASSRNDGCVHVGIDLHKGQEKLKYNGLGNKMYADLCADLAVPFKRDGHLILMYAPWEKRVILKIWKLVAKRNGIEGVRFMPLDELKQHNPNVPDWAIGAYYMPSGGIVSPYKLVVAYAENAAENGVKVCLNTAVTGMKVEDGTITAVETNRGTVYPRLVVNAAGVFSDKIADMAGDRTFTIHPRKGINLIMDKKIHTLAYGSTAKMTLCRRKQKL
jgi:Predicted dehydrogenase